MNIKDTETLVAAKTNTGHTLPIWDDGFGPLWVAYNEFGPVGVVRANTWEDAYEAAIDEIFHDADVDEDDFSPDGEPPEGVSSRGSCFPSNDHIKTPYADTLHATLYRWCSGCGVTVTLKGEDTP